jgi:hypothetical protein
MRDLYNLSRPFASPEGVEAKKSFRLDSLNSGVSYRAARLQPLQLAIVRSNDKLNLTAFGNFRGGFHF